MPISFPSDSGAQQGGTFTAGSIFYATVNQQKLDTTSNTLKTFIDNKQDTLTNSTALLGNGSSITAINWNNITTNKPSTFASDWGTLANKPSTFPPDTTGLITTTGGQTINGNLSSTGYIYTQNVQPISTGVDAAINIRSRLAGAINFYAETTGTINFIINGANRFYVNSAGNAILAGGLYEGGQLISSKYQATLTASTTLLGIGSNLTLINYNALSNLPNLSQYATTSSLSGYQLLLTASTTLSGIGSNLTLINYNALSNLPNLALKESVLTFSAPLTRTTNTISLDLSTYLTSAIASTTYQPKITTYTLSPSGTATFNSGTLTFDLSGYQTTASLGTTYLLLSGGTMTGTLTGTTINATTNLQEAGVNLITKYQGNINATAVTTTTVSQGYPPSYLTASTSSIYNTQYGIGTYTTTSGSDYSGQAFFQCLGANPSVYPGTGQWTNTGGFNTAGSYIGAARTIINTVSTAGEFGSIQLPFSIIMTGYTLTSASSPYHNYMMRDFVLCASNDGVNFTQLDSRTGVVWTALQTINYTFTNTTSYLHYRIVIKKTSNFNYNSFYTYSVCDGFTLSGSENKNGATIPTLSIGTNPINNVSLNVLGTTIHNGVSFFNGISLFNSNVGIGTSNPLTKLDVRGQINSESLYVVDSASYGANQYGLIINSPSSTGGALIQTIQQSVGTNQNLMLQRDGSGYVYIGGTTSTGLRIAGWDGNTIFSGVNPIGITALNNVYISTGTTIANYTSRLFINTTGYVGIGTNNPRIGLDVQDRIYIGGSLNTNTPQTGNYGGTGDRLILWAGGSSYPFSLGIASSTLWYSVPAGSIHAFYIGGGEIIRFNSVGMGFGNTNPQSYLHLGNCDLAGSSPVLLFGKRLANNSGFRTAFIGYNDAFYFCIGDAGSVNNTAVLVQSLKIAYSAPDNTLALNSDGKCYSLQFVNTSDERIKTDIETIDDALWKVQQLRGVSYKVIQEGFRAIGLIAQEVENIIPEVVSKNETTGLKGIDYNGLVGLLVNAIKEQQSQIEQMKQQINFLLNKV